MNKQLKNFAWGMGGFMAVAVFAYLANLGDIADIDMGKIKTLLLVSASGYIVNAITKKLNKK